KPQGPAQGRRLPSLARQACVSLLLAGVIVGRGRQQKDDRRSGMITMLGSPRLSCDGLTRRETLKVGALSLLGGYFNLPSLLALEEARRPGARPGKAKSVLLIYLQGGPATQDMFDLKPNAPSGIRTEFKPIATSAPGIQICEHLPRMARWMHRAAV